jgi:hypothetical protein
MQKFRWQYIIIFIGIIILWSLCWLAVSNSPSLNGWSERGQFGDMFGAVNALFSGLAFAGIIITILLQREELSLQRSELQLTRSEFSQQNETLRSQRFENTFFNLLQSHINLLDNLSITDSENDRALGSDYKATVYRGRDVFQKFVRRLEFFLGEIKFEGETITNEETDKVEETFHNYANQYHNTINLFIQSLCSLLTFVAKSDLIKDEQRMTYVKIVFSNVSQDENTFLYYYYSSVNWDSGLGNSVFTLADLFRDYPPISGMIGAFLFEETHGKLRDLWKYYEF